MRLRARSGRLWLLVLLALVALAVTPFLSPPSQAQAHPLGNFTINRYSRIELSPGTIQLRYVLDMAEIPAFQERREIDTDGDGALSVSERNAYLEQQIEELRAGLQFTINGTAVELRSVASELTFPPGQGGLDTQRLVVDFAAAMPDGWDRSAQEVAFRDDNYRTRLGWREIVVRSAAGVTLVGSSVPADDLSDELRAYPDDGIANPLNVSNASFGFEPAAATASPAGEPAPPDAGADQARAVRGNPDAGLARYANLIVKDRLTVGVVIVTLLAAAGFGAIHALSPGHGKTVVAAYLVGSRGTARQALLLGLTVTATHTSSVYALGFVTLYLSGRVLPEDLYPWLTVSSGGLILVMGLSLFVGRLRSSGLFSEALGWLTARPRPFAWRRAQVALAVAGPGVSEAPATSGPSRLHRSESGLLEPAPAHSHGFAGSHSHLPQDGQPLTGRSLIGLGIFGGLLPCPSAIVVMLSAIALHRVAFGLLLILAFSVGLAAVLTGIGFVLVYAGKVSGRLPFLKALASRAQRTGGITSLAVRLFPIGSAAAVVLAGLVVALRGLFQQGIL